MRKMLQTLKSYFDRRLRERCVKLPHVPAKAQTEM